MATAQDHIEAMEIHRQATALITAFDDAAAAVSPPDRRVTYAALIKLMETFAGSSPLGVEAILSDFVNRVMMGINSPKVPRQ